MTLLEWKKKEGVTYRWIMNKTEKRYSRQWLSLIFHGKYKPSPQFIKKLNRLTGLSVEEIIGGEN
jgi:hypothetical protein